MGAALLNAEEWPFKMNPDGPGSRKLHPDQSGQAIYRRSQEIYRRGDSGGKECCGSISRQGFADNAHRVRRCVHDIETPAAVDMGFDEARDESEVRQVERHASFRDAYI